MHLLFIILVHLCPLNVISSPMLLISLSKLTKTSIEKSGGKIRAETCAVLSFMFCLQVVAFP